jgi:L-serine deaminase
MNKYRVVEKGTEAVVAENYHTRRAARDMKRSLELERQRETGSQNRPSAYYVETSSEHPDGEGIYLH